MRLLSLSEASMQPRTRRLKLPKSEKSLDLPNSEKIIGSCQILKNQKCIFSLKNAFLLPKWLPPAPAGVRDGGAGEGGQFPKIYQVLLVNFGKFWQTLQGSFSAVSTFLIARLGAFFRIFQKLQDLHSFCTAPNQTFQQNSPNFAGFRRFSQNFVKFRGNLSKIAKCC